MNVDKGISRYVDIFLNNGIETYQSCQGGPGHCYSMPTIEFYGNIGTGWKVLQICLDFELPIVMLSQFWDIKDNQPIGPYWRVEFKPPKKYLGKGKYESGDWDNVNDSSKRKAKK